MGKAIGIDLGTTNSCAAVIENNQPKIIMYKGGNYTIPSLFAIDEQGQTLVGHDARKQAQTNPQNTVFGAKRLIGRNFHSKAVERIRQIFTYNMVESDSSEVLIKVKDRVFNLEQISAEILKKIKEVAEEYLQEEVANAVITVPAYFNDRQRQAVRNAGKLAQLNVLRILNEPTAAALAYGLGRNLRQRLAVYDLGGGTFDISIIEIHDKIFEVVATGGDTFLGGVDFDDRVMGFIMDDFQRKTGIDLSFDRVAIQRIRDVAERAKINLSSTTETRIEIPFIARGPKGILNIDITLTREQLEELVGDLVERTVGTCEKIMSDAGIKVGDINEVLLVGGQSRMPMVQGQVTDFFQRQPCKGVHPDEAVAVGAAILAHSLTQAGQQRVTLLDVLPMPIGIARGDGTFLRLFPKNSPIPSYKSLILTNSKEGQRSIMIKIYQGDSDIAAENELLGSPVFRNIRPGAPGTVKVEVIFHIDSEGVLHLSAKDRETGQPLQANLKLRSKRPAGTDAPPSEGDDAARLLVSTRPRQSDSPVPRPPEEKVESLVEPRRPEAAPIPLDSATAAFAPLRNDGGSRARQDLDRDDAGPSTLEAAAVVSDPGGAPVKDVAGASGAASPGVTSAPRVPPTAAAAATAPPRPATAPPPPTVAVPAPPPAQAPPARAGLFARLLAWIRSLFGGG
ncbi:Hsp70 family protein [Myxococcota bacterium]|nr:Hsp70 family protein [Myxococcota bacterium]